jgi:tetrahydromethanopterin S-methyltransferase subunit B
MSADEQIGKIYSIVSEIRTDVAVLKNNANHTAEKINDHVSKLKAIDEVISFFKEKEAQVSLASKLSYLFFGFIGTTLGGVLAIIVTKYFLR